MSAVTTPTPAQAAVDGLPPAQRFPAILTVLLGIALCVLDGTVMNLALPGIARDMQVSASEVIWVVNAYQVAILALLLPLALLGDLFGYRKVYLAGLVLFTVASLGCMLSRSLLVLCLARAVQGAGAAGMFAVNAALVRQIYPRSLLGRGMAINSAVVAGSSVAGPPLSALVLSIASWPWLFAINIPLGIVVMVLGRRALPAQGSPRAEAARVPWVDIALNAAAFALLFLGVDGLIPRGSAGVSVAAITRSGLMLATGLAVGAVYARRQLREAVPLLPLDLLRIPVFTLSMCTSIAGFTAQMLASISLPFLLLESLHLSHADVGLVLAAWPLATVVTAPVTGRLIGRVSDGLLSGVGLLTLGAGLVLAVFLPQQPASWDIAWRLALCGVGFSLFQSPNNHTIVTSAPANRAGAAGGMLSTARLVGQAFGAVLVALLFSLWAGTHGRGSVIALGVAAACAAAGSIASMMRVRSPAPAH